MNNLSEEIQTYAKFTDLNPIPDMIEKNLSKRIILRDYQQEALQSFITYYENEKFRQNKQIHTLFHMATGSGKTVIMAALILYLYTKGYRNFLFFVNQTNILEKTKDNFINPISSKYLFAPNLEYAGCRFIIKAVNNFSASHFDNDINLCFTTTQKLYSDLVIPKENSISFDTFENKKIVFISDESHHINVTTKLSKTETENICSWESAVLKVFAKNTENIMLEFTATADLKNKNINKKYKDKIIYDYPLSKFRKSGYTKDFQNFATDSSFLDMALMALILSEYRRYLFADLKINAKPVILFKSKTIKESNNFYDKFFKNLKSLQTTSIQKLYSSNMETLLEALDYFKNKDSSFLFLLNSLQTSFTKEKAIIMNGTTDNTKEKQLLVNSLEDDNNPIRIIFAVNMLNEGWDVLNLFDIVRLYDKRSTSYTTKEAQLIGRGARYFPFQINESQERFKRKYDYDLKNRNRILETMFFHSKNDSKYIYELNKALKNNGMLDQESETIQLTLKESFKKTKIYNEGFVFSNYRQAKIRSNIFSIEDKFKNKIFFYKKESTIGNEVKLFTDSETSPNYIRHNRTSKSFKFSELPINIITGVADAFIELEFSNLKEKYPNLKTRNEFLTSADYLGNCNLEIETSYRRSENNFNISGRDFFNALTEAFTEIAKHLTNIKSEYEGSKEFNPKPIKDVIRDKTIYVTKNKDANEHFQNIDLDLVKEPWYVYKNNYGTSEEWLAIKYFKTYMEPKLVEKKLNYYVVRNERIPELAIYDFETGERFEPDFLLLIEKADALTKWQVYLEPKGEHLIDYDRWKERFMLTIEKSHKINNNIFSASGKYIILGLPFYNSKQLGEFKKAFNSWIEKV